MSSIDSLSSSIYVPPSGVLQGTQSTQVSGSDPDGDGDGGQKVRKHGGHGHGQMQNLLMQALQSLGLGGAVNPSGSSSSTSTAQGSSGQSAGTDSDGDSDGSSSATGNIKSDMRKFMHALFQAVKGESSASTASGTSGTTGSNDPAANFASGLSALISQVSNGQAPSDLQNAFAALTNDLQGASNTNTTSTSGTTNAQVTLQALLSQMQQNLGYGATGSSSALGNIVSTHA